MTAESTTCPICEFVGDVERVYHHLQISHRKSALAEALVDGDGRSRGVDDARLHPGESD